MSNWEKAKQEVDPLVRELSRVIEGYDYSEKKAELTDKKLRRKLINDARKTKESVLAITELAYKNEESQVVESLREVIDEIDIFLNELEIKRVVYKDASEKLLKNIVKADALLVKNLQNINETVNAMYEQVLSGKPGDVAKKAAYIKKGISELRTILRDRCENV